MGILIAMLVAEYIGDFILQPREMALKKSSENKFLLGHAAIIFISLLPFGSFLGGKVLFFTLINAVCHAVQDKFIWNGYKFLVKRRLLKKAKARLEEAPSLKATMNEEDFVNLYAKDFQENKEYAEDKAFYDTIGLDRLLHVITLITLYSVFFM